MIIVGPIGRQEMQIVRLDSCSLQFRHCVVAKYTENIMHNTICVTGVYSRETINKCLVGQASRLVENFNIGIFSDTINIITVKLCMMVLIIEFYLFIPLSVNLN